MNWQPTLVGPRLTLRPLRREDFEDLFVAASDPLIWKQHPKPTRYQRDVFTGYFNTIMGHGGALAVIDNNNKKIIGSSGMYDYKPAENSVVIGYTFLERKYWGGSYNREMKKLMMDYAFEFVENILFEVGQCNVRSQMAMKKIGGKIIQETILDGKDYLIFQVKKSDYKL